MKQREPSIARFFQRLKPVVPIIFRFYWLFIFCGTLLTAGGLYLTIGGYFIPDAPRLRIQTDLSSLIPHTYQSVRALDEMKESVGGIDKIEVLLECEDFDASLQFAKELTPQLLRLKNPRTGEPYISSVEYEKPVEFFEKYQLFFVDLETLENLQERIDERILEEKIKLSPLYIDLSDGDEEEVEEGGSLADLEKKYESHVPKRYLATNDRRYLLMRCYVNGSTLDVSLARNLYNEVKELVGSRPLDSYHPSLSFELGGEVRNRFEEYDIIIKDALRNLAGGLILQLVLIMFFFRQPIRLDGAESIPRKGLIFLGGLLRQVVAAFSISLPLLMSIVWTFGITYLVIGQLNTITVFLFVVLFGMGIDFGIHAYARYLEARADGADVPESLETGILKTGAGICTAALTTSAAFYSLQITEFRGFSDFGFIAGTGILCAMVAMLFVLPAFVTLAEKLGVVQVREARGSNPKTIQRLLGYARPAFWICLVAAILIVPFLPRLEFEYNFRNLRAEIPALNAVKQKIHNVNVDAEGEDLSSPAILLAKNPEDMEDLVKMLREIKDSDTDVPTIGKVESIMDRFPQNQEEKLKIIREIREQVNREGLKLLKGEDKVRLERLQKALEADELLTMAEVPMSLKRRFLGKDGEIGDFIFIYPDVLLRDGKMAIEFARDIHSLSMMDGIKAPSGNVYYASSGSIVLADMLLLIQRDVDIAVVLTSVIIILFVFLEFRSLRHTLLVLAPSMVGFLWLFGVQLLFGIKFNLYNIVVLPLIVGYGIDDGVHLMHRYLEEGVGEIATVLRTTGRTVVMTTVTTTAGFSGLVFVHHGGLNSLGDYAILGLGLTMVAALFFLPAALRMLEGRRKV